MQMASKKDQTMNKEESQGFGARQPSSESGARPFSRILQEIVNHLAEIVRCEVRLARVEVQQDLAQVARAGAFLAIAAVFALFALGFILLGVVYALGTSIALWLSAVIVGVGAGFVGAIFALIGRKKLERAELRPEKTIRSLQENVTWMKKQFR
jgi:uncharacterized membrane protein YqjE